MYSFCSKLVEFRFRVATRFAQAEHYRHHRFFASSGCRCDASWRRAGGGHTRGEGHGALPLQRSWARLRVIVGQRSEREAGIMPRSKPQASAIALRHRRRTF